MKKVLIIIVLLIIGYGLFFVAEGGTKNMVSPGLNVFNKPRVSESPIPTPAPPVAPKSFKFDRSTDLEAELEQVDPRVLDSDFQ